jgi:fimbrial chaperone protein
MRSITSEPRAIASLAAIVALSLGAVGAQAVTVSPVLVELSPARRIVSITISNAGDTSISYQAQTLAWTQVNGVDEFVESNALLVSPAIASIPAGGTQIFRVASRLPPGSNEQAFRLIFEDVGELAKPVGRQMSVSLRVNHNLPVFLAASPDSRALPKMTGCNKSAAAGMTCVRIENQGDHYLQISGVFFGDAQSRRKIALSGRVLAGSWKQFEIALPKGLSVAPHLEVATSVGPIAMGSPGSR